MDKSASGFCRFDNTQAVTEFVSLARAGTLLLAPVDAQILVDALGNDPSAHVTACRKNKIVRRLYIA